MAQQKQISLSNEASNKVDETRVKVGKFNFSNFVEWCINNKVDEYLKESEKD